MFSLLTKVYDIPTQLGSSDLSNFFLDNLLLEDIHTCKEDKNNVDKFGRSVEKLLWLCLHA